MTLAILREREEDESQVEDQLLKVGRLFCIYYILDIFDIFILYSQGGETCRRGPGLPEPRLSQVRLAMIALLMKLVASTMMMSTTMPMTNTMTTKTTLRSEDKTKLQSNKDNFQKKR